MPLSSLRDIRLCLGHNLQHGGFALSIRGECAVDRGREFVGRIHALGLRAQSRAHLGVIPAQLIAPKTIRSIRHMRIVLRHHAIIEHNRKNRNLCPNSRLQIQPRHPKRGIAHQIDHLLLWRSQLRAHCQAQTISELR